MRKRTVKILAYDHNTDTPVYPYRIQQQEDHLFDSVAWHCYQGPVADYRVIEDFHLDWPDVPQFMTECANTIFIPGEANFWVAQNFIPAINNGSSGGLFWVMVTDTNFGPRSPYGGCANCVPLIIVNSTNLYTRTNDYYMVGHFSRFIRRGAVNYRIASGNVGSGTDYVAQFYTTAVQNPDGGWGEFYFYYDCKV
jgi:glucan endo-1,6-beta-glucosidase